MQLYSRKIEAIWNKIENKKQAELQVTVCGNEKLVYVFCFFTFYFEINVDLLKSC